MYSIHVVLLCCTYFFQHTQVLPGPKVDASTPLTRVFGVSRRGRTTSEQHTIYITNTYNLQSKDTGLCTTGTVCKNFHAFLLECRFQMEATQDEVVTARGLGERVVSWNVGRSWPTAGVGPDRIGNHKCQVVAWGHCPNESLCICSVSIFQGLYHSIWQNPGDLITPSRAKLWGTSSPCLDFVLRRRWEEERIQGLERGIRALWFNH